MDETITCARCGAPTASAKAMYTSDGMICAACEDVEVTNELWKGASAKLLGSAGSSIIAGVGCWFFDFCFAISIFAIASGVGAIAAVARQKEYRDHLGPAKLTLVIVLGAAGAFLAIAKILLNTVLVGIAAAL